MVVSILSVLSQLISLTHVGFVIRLQMVQDSKFSKPITPNSTVNKPSSLATCPSSPSLPKRLTTIKTKRTLISWMRLSINSAHKSCSRISSLGALATEPWCSSLHSSKSCSRRSRFPTIRQLKPTRRKSQIRSSKTPSQSTSPTATTS